MFHRIRQVFCLVGAAALSSCGGGGGSASLPSGGSQGLPASTRIAQSTTSSCSVAEITDNTENLSNGVGASPTDAWATAFQGDGSSGNVLAHFVNGTKVASYTVPPQSSNETVVYTGHIRIIDGAPWALGMYGNQSQNIAPFAARFDGSKFVPYALPATTGFDVPDIAGSASTGIYLAHVTTNSQLAILRFTGNGFTPVATSAPYAHMSVSGIAVFGKDIYVLLGLGSYAAYVAHWNGATFTVHQLLSGQYKGNPVQLTGTSQTDLWAVTATGIWHDNGNWQPYAYQQQSTDQAGTYMEGIVEFNPHYVVVPNMYGSNGTPGALVYNGVDRFLPLNIVMPSTSDQPIDFASGVPGTTDFYASYWYWTNGFGARVYKVGLVKCPSSPPA